MDVTGPSASRWLLTPPFPVRGKLRHLEPGDLSQTAPSFGRLQYLCLGLLGAWAGLSVCQSLTPFCDILDP